MGGQTANHGFGISVMVARILLEGGHPQAETRAIEQGAMGGKCRTDYTPNSFAYVPSAQQVIYFQGAGSRCRSCPSRDGYRVQCQCREIW